MCQVEGALQWTKEAYTDTLLGYANSIKTSDGGTHLDGLKTSLTRAVNAQARKAKLLKDQDANLGGEHVREGALSRAIGAHDRVDFAGFDLEVEPPKDGLILNPRV